MVPASVLPTWNSNASSLTSPLPHEPRFWAEPRSAAEHSLAEVRGFISALPIRWTEGENIGIPYPTSLIVRMEPKSRNVDDDNSQVETALQPASSKPLDRLPT
jgi:phospholipase D1/2